MGWPLVIPEMKTVSMWLRMLIVTDYWSCFWLSPQHIFINAHTKKMLWFFFRLFDHSMEGFKNWEFMTIHCWGERAAGDWILEVYDTPSQLRNFKTPGEKSFQIHLYCRRKWWATFEPKNVPHLRYQIGLVITTVWHCYLIKKKGSVYLTVLEAHLAAYSLQN